MTCHTGSRFCFREGHSPCFVEFAHLNQLRVIGCGATTVSNARINKSEPGTVLVDRRPWLGYQIIDKVAPKNTPLIRRVLRRMLSCRSLTPPFYANEIPPLVVSLNGK